MTRKKSQAGRRVSSTGAARAGQRRKHPRTERLATLARPDAPKRRHEQGAGGERDRDSARDVVLDCGWGRVIMAHTFRAGVEVARALEAERPGQRDIAVYSADPHVIVGSAPQSVFLDPSHTYRLWLSGYRARAARRSGFVVRRLRTRDDAAATNELYTTRQMVPVDPDFIWRNRTSRRLTYVVAEDKQSGAVIGTVTGIDHVEAFGDVENGSSLWCLAVHPQAAHPGVGEALARYLAEHYAARGRAFMDLSVMHDNAEAIALYEKLGFQRIPAFSLKRRNAINEPLFTTPQTDSQLNPYARIVVNEARRRGIMVEVVDAEHGYFRLSLGGTRVTCRESLSELTSAIAMSRCQDKRVTHRVLADAGLNVPEQQVAGDERADTAFLREHGRVVVKPADGEQGQGISVGVDTPEALAAAIEAARRHHPVVLLEQLCPGDDLRVIVIGGEVVAAAVRRPAAVVGDGRTTVRDLIAKQSRRRAAATGGESRIPLDAETERCVRGEGLGMDDVPASGRELRVRKTANLHTGGTIHDVTETLHPDIADACTRAAAALEIPLVGFDLMVRSPEQPRHVFIEANERPGLANHEPAPTAERFVDLMFPLTAREQVRAGEDATEEARTT